jgi:FkbM family methyltransferase
LLVSRGFVVGAASRSAECLISYQLDAGESVKQLIKAILNHTPYRIVRDRGANRFQAIDASLRGTKERGFYPRVVIDGGAHLGSFSLAAKQIFPDAAFHLIEPQPACLASLRALCSTEGFVLHECALADRSGKIGFSPLSEPHTGAHVRLNDDVGADTVSAVTLDALFADKIFSDHRALLKMDLQGYELHALRGAAELLRSIEVILTEVSFFAQRYEPSLLDLIAFLDASGFQLYDIGALAGRTRDNRLNQGDFLFARKGSPLLEDGSWE